MGTFILFILMLFTWGAISEKKNTHDFNRAMDSLWDEIHRLRRKVSELEDKQ